MPSYALKTKPCRVYPGRYRWEIVGDDGSVVSSAISFATEQEAELVGGEHLQMRMSERKNGRRG
jgi:hypothetical protein